MSYVVDPLHPNDPGFRGKIPAWAKNLKVNPAYTSSDEEQMKNNNLTTQQMQALKNVNIGSNQNIIPLSSDDMKSFVPDHPSKQGFSLSKDQLSNFKPEEPMSSSSSPDFSKDPAGYLESLLPTGQTFVNLGKDITSAFGTTGQNLLNLGSQMSVAAPFQAPTAAATPQGQQIIADTQKSLEPITQYDIPYHLNAPMSYGHQYLRSILGALPLSLAAGPEAGLAENALLGGFGSAAISDPKTANDTKNEFIMGAITGGLTHGLINAGRLASHYNFAKSGAPVDQIKNDIQLNEIDKQNQLDQLEASQVPISDDLVQSVANNNISNFSTDFNTKLNDITDGEGDVQNYIAKNNSFSKGDQKAKFDASKENDNLEIPDEISFNLMQPQHFENLKAWDVSPQANVRSAFQSMPEDLQSSLISKFQKDIEQPTKDSISSDLKEKGYDYSSLSKNAQETILDAIIKSRQNPMESLQGKSVGDLIDALDSPAEKAMAIKSMYSRGLVSPNAGKILDSMLPDDVKDVLNYPGGLVKTQKTDLERSKATLKDARDYAKAAKKAAKSTSKEDSFKRHNLIALARDIEQKILEPSMDHYDKKLGTKTLTNFKLGKALTERVIGPFKATSDTEKLANASLVNPSLERISKILKSGKEKLNQFKLGKELDENKTNLHPSEIPNDHILSRMSDDIDELKKFHANPELKAMSKGDFIGGPDEQVKAFEKAISSGKLSLNDPIVQKYYLPLKHQLNQQKLVETLSKENYKANKKQILNESELKKEALKKSLSDAKKLQENLIKKPSLIQSLLMNHARGVQIAASGARLARPLGYGLINNQNQ